MLRRVSLNADTRFLQTADGIHAYTAMLTIDATCRMLGIDTRDYLSWLVNNIKLRLELRRQTLGLRYQPCTMISTGNVMPPKDQRTFEDNTQGVRFGPNFHCQYDDVSLRGLTPWDHLFLYGKGKTPADSPG